MADTLLVSSDTEAKTVDQKIDLLAIAVKEGFDAVDKRFDGVDKRLDALEQKTTRMEATMVTKSYLDEKLADLKGDLIVKIRKLDGRMEFLEDLLRARAVLSDADVKRMRSEYQIFPSIA
jgi:hypothetical protein